LRGRRERGREEEEGEEGGREVLRMWIERNEGREVVRRRFERKEGERQ
jgi:hypothetical protein